MKNSYEVRGDVTAIHLKGCECLIDTDLLKFVSDACGPTRFWFVKTDIRDGKHRVVVKDPHGELPLRRVVTDATKDMLVTPINGDGLDCRRANLKILVKPQYAKVSAPAPKCPEGAALIPLVWSFAIVDKADLPLVTKYRWREKGGYVIADAPAIPGSGRRGAEIKLHRLLLGNSFQVIDHINGNPLDNRRSNLRGCSNTQNIRNSKQYSRSKAPYKGISKMPTGQYRAQICVNYRKVNLGNFSTPEAAAKAYDDAARKIFGEFARPNFPVTAGASL